MRHISNFIEIGSASRAPILSKPEMKMPPRDRAVGSGKQAARAANGKRSAAPAGAPSGSSGRQNYRKQAEQRKRQRQFIEAADASAAAGSPVTFKVCLTWHALISAGERREGNSLHLPEGERVKHLWRNIRTLHRRHSLPFLAMRAPEYGSSKGPHLHLALCLPSRLLPDLVAVLSRHTGASLDIEPSFTIDERNRGHVARSACRGWLIQRNTRIGHGGERGAATYISKSMKFDGTAVQYRLSDELSALVSRQNATQRAISAHLAGGSGVGAVGVA